MNRRRFMNEVGVDNNTLLLLHFDNNYTDGSPYQRTPISTNNLYYASGQFGNSLSVSSLNIYIKYSKTWFVNIFNTRVYTIDFWSKNSIHWASFFGIDDGSSNAFVCRAQAGTYFQYGIYNDLILSVNVSELDDGLFHHYAIVSDGSRVHLYVDGILKKSSAIKSVSFPNVDLTIGGRVTNTAGVNNVNYLDELRISSVARWTSNFTPKSKPY